PLNKRHRQKYCGGHVPNSRKQTDNWIQAKAAFCPGNAQEIIHDERKPSEKGFKRGIRSSAAGSVFGRQNFHHCACCIRQHFRNKCSRARSGAEKRSFVVCPTREAGHPRQTPPNGQELHSATSVLWNDR